MIIKKALNAKYGYQNVSVRSDTGTARDWVKIHVKIARPINEDRSYEQERKMSKQIINEAREALALAGDCFSTYGENGRECVTCGVTFLN